MKSKIGILFSFVVSFALLAQSNLYSNNYLTANFDAVQVSNNNVEDVYVIPSGKSIGITLNTDGVIVTNLSNIQCQDGEEKSPALEAGLKNGDIIKTFDEKKVTDVAELNRAISETNGETVTITVLRGSKTINTKINPEYCSNDGKLRIGAWVKDAMSGIGTLTFYNPQDDTFASLGHGICNPETGEIISVNNGNIINSSIVDVQKGEKGKPGELKGIFSEDNDALGTVTQNIDSGIYGKLSNTPSFSHNPLPIAKKNDIQTGAAYILANIEGNTIEKFDIEITKVIKKDSKPSKNMIIKITDKRLIEKTGGIVQGMSGSPIIQNDKIVGAVTHVFVNDPTKGYGIFIENMLKEIKK